MKYLILLAGLMSVSVQADLPIVENCKYGKTYKAVDQHGNVIVVSCQVYRVVSTKAGKA